jgi:hypothetical protein
LPKCIQRKSARHSRAKGCHNQPGGRTGARPAIAVRSRANSWRRRFTRQRPHGPASAKVGELKPGNAFRRAGRAVPVSARSLRSEFAYERRSCQPLLCADRNRQGGRPALFRWRVRSSCWQKHTPPLTR